MQISIEEQSSVRSAVLRLSLTVFALLFLSSPASAADNCLDCHAGQERWPLAPDVSAYWYGSGPLQDGGHGDEDGFPSLECAGAFGCHDIAADATHRNGILEGVGSPSPNTFHLQDRFVIPLDSAPWSYAEAFNTACMTGCHDIYGIRICTGDGHSGHSDIPGTPRFGYSGTPADADGGVCGRPVLLPLDSDVTIFAQDDNPVYGLCISCHDPHGTGTRDPYRQINRMLRLNWASQSDLCLACHVHAPSTDDKDADGIPDCLDPFPESPVGTDRYISLSLQTLSASFSEADVSRWLGTRGSTTAPRHILARRLSLAAAAVDRERIFHAARMLERLLAVLESGRRAGGQLPPEEKEALHLELEYLLELLGYLL